MAKKLTYNQMLIGEGYNFGQRMNMIRVKRQEEKRKKQEATLKWGMNLFESGTFARMFKPKK